MISQNAISGFGHGGRRKLPYVFTEHGALMAANVLKSKRAVEMSVFVVRAFIRLREMALSYRELAEKLKEIETTVGLHDQQLQAIINAIKELMKPPEKPKRQIGFRVSEKIAIYEKR